MMKKALLYRLMGNLNEIITETKLTHREISGRVGNAENWFNDAYNNNEDVYISSFTRVLSVIDGELDLGDYNLVDIFDGKILKIASLMHYLSDNDVAYFDKVIVEDRGIFVELVADWKSMDFRRKLNDVEKYNLNQIEILLSKEDV